MKRPRGLPGALALTFSLVAGFGAGAQADEPPPPAEAPEAAPPAADQACESTPGDTRLFIVVENVRPGRGLLTASVYTDDGRFLKPGGIVKEWSVAAGDATQTVCVWLPKPGTYGPIVYQVLDSNHELNTGLFGPTEPWGASNNPRGRLGPPHFDDVKFQAEAGDTTLHVRFKPR